MLFRRPAAFRVFLMRLRDHPLKEVTADARMEFVSFFDWDQLDFRDRRYVRLVVSAWPSHPEAVGKHAFMESHYVGYAEG